jgi:hypothetical protein
MSINPILRNSSFDPEDLKMLASAFDEDWEAIQGNGGTLSRPLYATHAMRELLAKRIIAMAQRGQNNPHSLSEDAIQYLTSNYRVSLAAWLGKSA